MIRSPYRPRFSISEHPLCRDVKRFRGRLVFKARRLEYHSTLGLRVIKKRKKKHSQVGSWLHVLLLGFAGAENQAAMALLTPVG